MSDEVDLLKKLHSVSALQQTMSDYFLRLKQAADTQQKKIAWCTSVGPMELLYAMDFEVYVPENHAAMIGAAKVARPYILAANKEGYSPEVCSYMTSDIGAYLMRKTPLSRYGFTALPKPDVLIYNTNQCSEVQDWFEFYGRVYQVPVLGVHTPCHLTNINSEIINYIVSQYQSLIKELEVISACRFQIDKFKESVKKSRQACVLWKQILEMATYLPSPINFFDASIHMGPIVVMRGTQMAIDYYDILLQELIERVSQKISSVPKEDFRIYWDGMPLWYRLSHLAKLFAKFNTCVVASTYCNSWIFDDLDPDDPFRSSALAYTKLFIVRSDPIKEDWIRELLTKYSVDGIIYHDVKTCHRNSNCRFGLHMRLHNITQLPYLIVNGDMNDDRCFSEEQNNLAIETFIEQLKMRK